MMRRKVTGIVLAVLLAAVFAMPASMAEPLQECHRVTNTAKITTQGNKSQVKLWHADTANAAVTEEINGLAEAWAEELSPALKPAARHSWEVAVRDDRGVWLEAAQGCFETGLDADGWNLFVDSKGYASVVREYDEAGNVTTLTWLSLYQRPHFRKMAIYGKDAVNAGMKKKHLYLLQR